MTGDEYMDDSALWSLKFNCTKQLFYHEKLWGWYIWLNHFLSFTILALSIIALTVFMVESPKLAAFIGLVACLLSIISTLGDYSRKAYQQSRLRKAYNDLVLDIDACQNPTMELIARWQNRRSTFDDDAIPTLRAVDSVCHNEAVSRFGITTSEEYLVIPPWRKKTMFLFMHSSCEWERRTSLS